MKLDAYTILHRKDERGVIVESRVFGPDDEVPEGFGKVDYTKIAEPAGKKAPVAESVLTPWASPMKTSWVGEPLLDDEPEDDEPEDDEPEDDEPEDDEPEDDEPEDDEPEDDESDDDEPEDDGVQPPPKGGAGSGVEAWAAYAAAKDVEVPEGATRDDIIAACEAAGVPVD